MNGKQLRNNGRIHYQWSIFLKTLLTEETKEFYIKEDGDFIGFIIGFHRATVEADLTPYIEIGWRLKKGYGKNKRELYE